MTVFEIKGNFVIHFINTINVQYFSGLENHLMYLRRYYTEVPCIYNLRFFPFDKQRCKIIFKIRTATVKTVILVPDLVEYTKAQTNRK